MEKSILVGLLASLAVGCFDTIEIPSAEEVEEQRRQAMMEEQGWLDPADCADDDDHGLIGDECTVGLGQCKRSAEHICTLDGVVCGARAPSTDGLAETCDNDVDDDCDGEIDEAPEGGCCDDSHCAGEMVCIDDRGGRCVSLGVSTGGMAETGGIINFDGGAMLATGGVMETGGVELGAGGVMETGGVAETGGAMATGGVAETGGDTEPGPSICRGDYEILAEDDYDDIIDCNSITGTLAINIDVPIDFQLGSLTTIGGDLTMKSEALTALDFPLLTTVGGKMEIYEGAALSTLDFPLLTTVGGIVRVANSDILPAVEFPELTAVEGSLMIHDNDRVSGLNFPELIEVGGSLYLARNPSLTEIKFPQWSTIGYHFEVYENTSLRPCALYALRDQMTEIPGTTAILDNNGTGSCP